MIGDGDFGIAKSEVKGALSLRVFQSANDVGKLWILRNQYFLIALSPP